jgi:hypothetical protein
MYMQCSLHIRSGGDLCFARIAFPVRVPCLCDMASRHTRARTLQVILQNLAVDHNGCSCHVAHAVALLRGQVQRL